MIEEKINLAWAKFMDFCKPTFIGGDTIALGSGNLISFTNIKTGKETLYRTSVEEFGEGISCISGHRNLNIFAFAELCIKPRIFIASYPSLKHIQVFQSENSGAYVELRFSESEYLIALSGVPNCQLEIWNWRSGKLLFKKNTGLNVQEQFIKCSRTTPLMIAQYAPKLGAFHVWETYVSLDQAFIIKRQPKLPFLNKNSKISLTFGIDGNIYLVDKIGNLFSLIPTTGSVKELWKWPSKGGDHMPNICFYKNGFVIAGCDRHLKFVKKNEKTWSEIWSIPLEQDIKFLRVLNYETLFCINRHALITQLIEIDGIHEFKKIGSENRFVKLFDLLYPVCKYIVKVSDNDTIKLLNIKDGKEVSSMSSKDITCIRSHPLHPMTVIGNQEGIVQLISFYNPSEPKILTEFHLSATWIESLNIPRSGNYLIVTDRFGDFFVINANIGGKMEVVAYFPHDGYVVDYCILDSIKNLQIVLFSASKQKSADELSAKKAENVIFNKSTNETETKSITLPHRYTSVDTFHSNTNQIVAAEFMNNCLHILQIDGENVIVIETISTLHQLKHVRLHCDLFHLVTWGMDGLVCIFDLKTKKCQAFYIAHSRRRRGIKNVRCDAFGKYVVSLGFKGKLQCVSLEPNFASKDKIENIEKSIANPIVKNMFMSKTIGFQPEGENFGKTWLEIKIKNDFEKEREEHELERKSILEDYIALQKKLTVLIDDNEKVSEEDKIDIQNFNLSKDWADGIVEAARLERNLEERAMKAYVSDQNRIRNWIIDNTWERINVKNYKIRGFFSNLFCENYALSISNTITDNEIQAVSLQRSIEILVSKQDCFLPWYPRKGNELEILLSKRPVYTEDEIGYNPRNTSIEDLSQDSKNELYYKARERRYALSGTSSHRFIDPLPYRYEQLEVVTFHQMFQENIMGQQDMLKLRIYFNKKFEDLKAIKDAKMEQVKKRNERLRHIQKELNNLLLLKNSTNLIHREILDPEYEFDEKPESIIKVEDWEISVTPFISPSRQDILHEQEQMLEKQRLESLANDFRDRALIKMMDGVLEKMWEDEIKKEPTKPDCMVNQKDPDDYNKEDLRAIKEYEEKIKSLETERKRYRLLLEEEQVKLNNTQDEQITKFNYKCAEICMEKFKVEAAIKQEELKLMNIAQYNYQRSLLKRKGNELMLQSQKKKTAIEELGQTIETVEKHLQECKTRYDQYLFKDRQLDKQFKAQFGESAPPLVVDQAYKIFKKRPKWHPRAWATSAILSDLANRISTKNSSKSGPPLPDECYDFINLIENIENYTNAPNSIDQNIWSILCQMRRIKMESEFKLKAVGAQLAEADATLNAFLKELNNMKSSQSIIERQRDELRQKYSKHLLDRSIQLVMKRGIVEVPLSGRMDDFAGCILLNASDVSDINSVIKQYGTKKLHTMQNSAVFRRKNIYKEWQHKVLRMTVEDLKDSLRVIDKCKVTKETQTFLKRKESGRVSDLSQTALNREKDGAQKYLQSSLDKINNDIHIVNEKIKAKIHENQLLDKKIQAINFEVAEQNLDRDFATEEKEVLRQKECLAMIVERGKLVRKVQAQHSQILELSTLLELQRLRTFPTLNVSQKNIFS